MSLQGSDGIRRRLDRADQHRQDIDAALEWWRNQNPDPWTGYSNPEKTEHRFHLTFNVQPDLIRWGLMFGDAVHNLRAALDNVVWLVAARDMNPAEPKRFTQFPIFLEKDVFFGEAKGKPPGLTQIDSVKDPGVRAIIERVQPWQREDRPDFDHLWWVHEFDRIDKHRVITPVLLVPRDITTDLAIEYASPNEARNALPPLFRVRNEPLEDGAEFLVVYTPTPPKKVQMKHSFALGVGITMSNEVGGITGTLGELCKHVRGIVEEILDYIA